MQPRVLRNIPLVDRTAGFIMHNCFFSGWRKTIGEVGCGWQWCQQAFCRMYYTNKTLTTQELSPWSCMYNLLLVHCFFFTQTNWGVAAETAWNWKYKGNVSFSFSLVVNLRQATFKTIASTQNKERGVDPVWGQQAAAWFTYLSGFVCEFEMDD